MKNTGPVQLREKRLKDGKKSLYLDIYQDGQRKYEFLRLYLLPGNDQRSRDLNKVTLGAARAIQAKRLVELETTGVLPDKKQKLSDYARKIIEEKQGTEYGRSLEIALEKWIEFAGEGLAITKVTPAMLREFGIWLKENCINEHDRRGVRKNGRTDAVNVVLDMHQNGYSQRAIIRETHLSERSIQRIIRDGYIPPRKLSPNSIRHYFDRINLFLERATRDGVIPRNPMKALTAEDKPQTVETFRQYLTLDELKILAKTPCGSDMSKRLFMFACFTGLRYSDAISVTWADIDARKVDLVQKKTKKVLSIPLSSNALAWLPERGSCKPEDLVFRPLKHLSGINHDLHAWAKDAGLSKDFSFHSSRHTFATLELTYGADLYTVSKLLGHTNISTTQIYAKIIDKKKEEAVNLIPSIND